MALLNPVLYTTRFKVMGGPATVRFVDRRGQAHDEGIARRVEAEALRIERTYSRYLPESVLSRINASAGKAPVTVDEEALALVGSALDLARLTRGRFDPTVGVLNRVWDFRRGRVPSTTELRGLLPLVNWEQVRVLPGALYLEQEGMELDLGGVGKEYAVDRVAELLRREGVDSALVNFAGDVRTLGRRGDGRPWSVGIQDPRDPQRCRFALRVRERAGVATSGDYERFFEKDGVRYHHLLDATTGMPARGLTSVTVVAPTALAAGRLATAAFLLGPEEGLALLETRGNVEGALITEAGEMRCTQGMGRISDLSAAS
jgi:thiamine biosynthesis lipoprotein